MARTKITARLNANLADALLRVSQIDDRSVSDVVEDAVARYFDRAHSEAEHHALMSKLDRLASRLGSIERNQETLFELTAHSTRFAMSVAPDVPDRDKTTVNARGSERFRNVIAAIVNRVSSGKSVWRENFAPHLGDQTTAARQSAAAE